MTTPRFPLHEASDPETRKTLETQLTALHRGLVPLVSGVDDGFSLLIQAVNLSHAPEEVARGFMTLGQTMYRSNDTKPRNRELAIEAFISVAQVPYMRYCHTIIGEKKVGLSPEQVKDALAGQMPKGLSEEEEAAFHLGEVLARLDKPLDDSDWESFASKLPKSEIIGITNFIGAFQWLALLTRLNGKDSRWD
ncbi:hypothetical protein diail_10496 [Diaporthe ilicicola]|nr:hypothetical protein diail_10496 [Diaporthe ilicicola]